MYDHVYKLKVKMVVNKSMLEKCRLGELEDGMQFAGPRAYGGEHDSVQRESTGNIQKEEHNFVTKGKEVLMGIDVDCKCKLGQ